MLNDDTDRATEFRDAAPAGVELRFCPDTEVRAEGGADGKPAKIVGYAALYNEPSKPMRTARGTVFRERILPGAFGAVDGVDVMARYNHQLILGRTSSGTMKLTADERGLKYEIQPVDSAAADHVVKSIQRGDVRGSSFAFRTVKDGWKVEDGVAVRELQAVSLIDVGPVDNPAYDGTRHGDAAVQMRAEGTDEAAVDAAVAKLPGVEARYYYNPKASETTGQFRDAVDRARSAYDAAQVVVDLIAARNGGALTDEEKRAAADAAKALQDAADRCQEAADACGTLTLPTGGVRSATPNLDARAGRRARLV